MIPESPDGYAVDAEQRTVHKRYAEHARHLPRTRTVAGVVAYFGPPSSVKACGECFPQAKAKPRRKRCAS